MKIQSHFLAGRRITLLDAGLLAGVVAVLPRVMNPVPKVVVAVTTHLGRAAGNGHRVLESLYQRPILSVAEVQALTGTTFTAANSLVARLVRLKILQEATGYKRNRVFRYQPCIAIFGEDSPAAEETLDSAD